VQLNLLRRGRALNGDISSGRWDLVDSKCNDEEKSIEDDSEEDGSEEDSILATPTERVYNKASYSRRNNKTALTEIVQSASSSKKKKS
jgi:hypothetical protein